MAMRTVKGGRVDIRMWTDPAGVEDAAMQQLRNASALPWTHGVAVMPDTHYGKGATIGSVIAMNQAVSPAAVGVDIGCGMSAVRTSLTADQLPDDLGRMRSAIEAAVPVGREAHKAAVDVARVKSTGDWDDFWSRFEELDPKLHYLRGKAANQIGTLGGGNHFIEICLDEAARVWIMLHSGSRNIGNVAASRHIEIAKNLAHNQDLPDRDLAVFIAGTTQMAAYRRDLFWCQDYAARNRAVMLHLVEQAFARAMRGVAVKFGEPISCHHNYVAEETYDGVDVLVTRKGAIRAGSGELGIIPGSMGTKSFIVRGLGNAAAFNSASHGAGRRMSRNEAKRRFNAADLAAQTVGVECRKDLGVVDEIPAAYKDIDEVMANQSDLVEVVHTLKQVICVKG